MKIKDVLQDLMLTKGISGYEGEVAAKLASYLAPYADSLETDRAGNVICKISGTGKSSRRVMVFAHMDSLGFIVRRITDEGYILIERLGGIPEKALPASKVIVCTQSGGEVAGVIGLKALHATSEEEKYRTAKINELYVDIGAASRAEVLEAGIHIGSPVIYKPSFELLGNDIVCGTTVDNRAGCAALVDIARSLHENRPDADVYVVGTVWEEYSIRGAIFAARAVKPDFAICLDISIAGDTPDTRAMFEAQLGAGPTVSLYNFHGRGTLNGTIAHKGLYELSLQCADSLGIKLQEFAGLGILTDASYVQLENNYVACLDIGYPARYAHSPSECCSLGDISDAAALCALMAGRINDSVSPSRY